MNVLVRGNEQSSGPARKLLLKLVEQGHTLLISREMLMELVSVFRYPRIQALYKLTDEQIYVYVQFLRDICRFVDLSSAPQVPIRDPKDISVLQTAVVGEADVICTLDRDFYAPDSDFLQCSRNKNLY